jgi:hypothetical protein
MEDEEFQSETTDTEDNDFQEQTTETEDYDSEVEENTSESRGDLRVPLKQERTKRQALEAQLNDPNFIIQRAKALGLTGEETKNQIDVTSEVKKQLEIEKAKEKYPLLRSNEALQYAVTAYLNRGMNPIKAADKVFAEIEKAKEEAAKESAEVEKRVVKDQEKAQTVMSSADKSGDDVEIERLVKQSKSWDKRVQMAALIELEKKRLTK